MAVLFSPFGNQQFSASGTALAVGHKIYTYVAGSSTPLATYTDSTGNVAQSNPIILNALGMPTVGQIWLTSGLAYKLVWTDASDVVIKTEDNITGVTGASSVSQWQASGLTPTYISAAVFTLAGDQTSAFHALRRLQFTTTAGTVYGSIASSAYGALTTVTMTMDSGQVLDSGLSAVNLSILTAANPSIPETATGTLLRTAADANAARVAIGLVPRRQTILSGAAAFLQIGTGLAVNVLATSTPLRMSFANGIGAAGALDYVSSITADSASFWSGLTVSTTNYLFVDRNTSTGALTGVATILPYIAQDSSAAVSVVNNQHTYVYDTGQMYVGNGATASAVQRTAVGECVTSGVAVTSVTPYAKMGISTSAIQAVSASQISINHNIGVQPRIHWARFVSNTTTSNYPSGYEAGLESVCDSTSPFVTIYGYGCGRLNQLLSAPGNGTARINIADASTGGVGAITPASWGIRFHADRGW